MLPGHHPAPAELSLAAGESPEAGSLAARLVGAGLLVCVLVFYGSSELGQDRFTVPKALALHAAAGLGAIVYLASRRPYWYRPFALACGSMVILSLISMARAHNGWQAAAVVSNLVSGIVLFLLACDLARAGQGARLLDAVALATILAATVALAEAAGIIHRLSMLGRAPGGVLGSRNLLSHLLVVGIGVVVLRQVAAQGRARRTAWSVGLAVVVAAITLGRSRASWLASFVLLAGSAAVVARRWSRAPSTMRRAFAIAALTIAVGASTGFLLGRRLGWPGAAFAGTLTRLAEHRAGTGLGRLIQYRATLHMIADHPLLGVGPGQWALRYPAYAAPGDPSYRPDAAVPVNPIPSSDWLGLAAELGLIAVVIAGALGITLAAQGWRAASAGQGYGWALLASLVALAIVGSLDAVLFLPETAYLAALALGTTAGLCLRERPGWRPAARSHALIALAIFFVVALPVSAARLVASSVRSSGRLEDLEAAFKLDPGNYVLATSIAARHASLGHCEAAGAYVRAAVRLYPEARRPLLIAQSCVPPPSKRPQ